MNAGRTVMPSPKKVLITGAYGLIGNAVYARMAGQPERYDVHALTRRRQTSVRLPEAAAVAIPDDKLHVADLTDFESLLNAVEGVDTVVHLAADPNGDAPWESILRNNITGGYNMFEASRQAGVKRLVYASTMQVLWGYRSEEPYGSLWAGRYEHIAPGSFAQITDKQPARPVNYYAASKVWGEGMAHVYAYKYGVSCLCVRIGWVAAEEPPRHPSAGPVWCSQRDIAQLFQQCVDAPDSLRFDIFHGLSNNTYNVADIQHARDVLGYAPVDSWDEAVARSKGSREK